MLVNHTSLQKETLNTARALASRFAEHAAQYDRDNTFPQENYDDIRESGYHLLTVPEEFGGKGAGLHDLCLGQEALAVGDGATSLGIGMHLSLLGRQAEERSWPDDIRERVYRAVVSRAALINSAATEPGMGSPSRGGAPVTVARRTANGWEMNGRKTFTTIALALDFIIVLAWVEEEEKRGQFLIEAKTPGVRVDETWDTLGMRATGSHDLVLENVHLPEEAYIRPRPAAPNIGPGRAWAALTLSATYLGVARAALDFAANFARNRVPSGLGKPISELDNIQEQIGRMYLAIQSARALLYSTTQQWEAYPEQRNELTPDIAATKHLATNGAIQVTDLAMRLVGGAALSRRMPLERLFRDARAGLYNPPSDFEALKLLGQWALGEQAQLR